MTFSQHLYDANDNYLAIEDDNRAITTLVNRSAVEFGAGTRVDMNTNVIRFSTGLSADDDVIPEGEFYPETTSKRSSFLMESSKFGQAFPLSDESLADGGAGVIDEYSNDWASKHAVKLDNACLATTNAGSPETDTPFNSVLYVATHNADSDMVAAGYTYTANDNYATTTRALLAAVSTSATTGGYNILSNFLALAEDSVSYSEADTVIVANTAFRGLFRTIRNSAGDPMFGVGSTQVSGFVGNNTMRTGIDTLFGVPILWSAGARVSASSSVNPTGDPLMILANRRHLLLGVRSGPERKLERIPGKDVTELMLRSRRAFRVADPNSVAVIRLTA